MLIYCLLGSIERQRYLERIEHCSAECWASKEGVKPALTRQALVKSSVIVDLLM